MKARVLLAVGGRGVAGVKWDLNFLEFRAIVVGGEVCGLGSTGQNGGSPTLSLMSAPMELVMIPNDTCGKNVPRLLETPM
jgi:hypothetical protein